MLRALHESLPEEAIVVADIAECRTWALQLFEATRPEGFIATGPWTSMGVGLPGAIGAKLANPDRPVVCLTGDGGLMQCIEELHTAAEEGIDVTTVAFDNSRYAMIDTTPGYENSGFGWRSPEFPAIAEGFGCGATTAETPVEAAAAVEWVADNAAAFGGDPDRLGVSGTSAGATLALAACLYQRETAGDPVDLAGQFLLYPIAGDDFETDSYRENADGPLLTRADMRWFFDRYLRSPVDAHNPFAVPLRADDLGDLPSATVVTAGFDPLRDDGVALAERFAAEGTPVEHRHYPAMVHGFCSLADRVDVAEAALSAVAGDVRERL